MSLRLGVMCAVIDDSGCLLLSQRGDLNTWNLPGGRLDPGETLEEAAVREVEEETGISAETERAVALIRRLTEGRTLLIVEHDMSVVFGLADRISVLVYGHIIASGTPDEIRSDPKVKEAYLGEEAA